MQVLPKNLTLRALVIFIALLAGESVLLAFLNREVPNNLLLPITQYLPMFSVIWKDNPWAALQVIADKSVLAIGHFDERSGLYLWTLELDAVAIALHIGVALLLSRFVALPRPSLALLLGGVALVLLSHSYVTVMAHCAGPTWAVFVSLYGLGVEKMPVNTLWQWGTALSGSMFIAAALWRKR